MARRQNLVDKIYQEYIYIGGMIERRVDVYQEILAGRRASGYSLAEARSSADYFAFYPPALTAEQIRWHCRRVILFLLASRAGYPLELEEVEGEEETDG